MLSRIRLLGILGIALFAWAAPPAAGGELTGTDVVRAKDTHARTVHLGERVFRVTAATVIHAADGTPISLDDLDVPDLARGEPDPVLGLVLGRYDGVQAGESLILRSLDLTSSFD